MRQVVRGFWGPGQESVEELAGRWSATLSGIADLLPAAGAAGPGAAKQNEPLPRPMDRAVW